MRVCAAPMDFQLIQHIDRTVLLGPTLAEKGVRADVNILLAAAQQPRLPEPRGNTWLQIESPGTEDADARHMNLAGYRLGMALNIALTTCPGPLHASAIRVLVAFRRMFVIQFCLVLMLNTLCRCVLSIRDRRLTENSIIMPSYTHDPILLKLQNCV